MSFGHRTLKLTSLTHETTPIRETNIYNSGVFRSILSKMIEESNLRAPVSNEALLHENRNYKAPMKSKGTSDDYFNSFSFSYSDKEKVKVNKSSVSDDSKEKYNKLDTNTDSATFEYSGSDKVDSVQPEPPSLSSSEQQTSGIQSKSEDKKVKKKKIKTTSTRLFDPNKVSNSRCNIDVSNEKAHRKVKKPFKLSKRLLDLSKPVTRISNNNNVSDPDINKRRPKLTRANASSGIISKRIFELSQPITVKYFDSVRSMDDVNFLNEDNNEAGGELLSRSKISTKCTKSSRKSTRKPQNIARLEELSLLTPPKGYEFEILSSKRFAVKPVSSKMNDMEFASNENCGLKAPPDFIEMIIGKSSKKRQIQHKNGESNLNSHKISSKNNSIFSDKNRNIVDSSTLPDAINHNVDGKIIAVTMGGHDENKKMDNTNYDMKNQFGARDGDSFHKDSISELNKRRDEAKKKLKDQESEWADKRKQLMETFEEERKNIDVYYKKLCDELEEYWNKPEAARAFTKRSSKLLQMLTIEKHMALTGDFDEANKMQKMARKQEQIEMSAKQDEMKNAFDREKQKLMDHRNDALNKLKFDQNLKINEFNRLEEENLRACRNRVQIYDKFLNE